MKEKNDFQKLIYLIKTNPRDCWLNLISDFLLNHRDLKERYAEEIKFKNNIKNRWK